MNSIKLLPTLGMGLVNPKLKAVSFYVGGRLVTVRSDGLLLSDTQNQFTDKYLTGCYLHPFPLHLASALNEMATAHTHLLPSSVDKALEEEISKLDWDVKVPYELGLYVHAYNGVECRRLTFIHEGKRYLFRDNTVNGHFHEVEAIQYGIAYEYSYIPIIGVKNLLELITIDADVVLEDGSGWYTVSPAVAEIIKQVKGVPEFNIAGNKSVVIGVGIIEGETK